MVYADACTRFNTLQYSNKFLIGFNLEIAIGLTLQRAVDVVADVIANLTN